MPEIIPNGSDFNISANDPLAMGTYPDWDSQVQDSAFFDMDSQCKANESSLYEDLLTESINIYGVDAYWYKVSFSLNNEKIFGEDNNKTIERKFYIKYFIDQLPVDTKVFNTFGIDGMDILHVYISKAHFQEASQFDQSGVKNQLEYEPHQGDIIWSSHNSTYYKVIEVKSQIEQFLQRRHTWDITIIPMKSEKINIASEFAIDDINNFVNIPDIMAQNNLIDTEKQKVLYQGPVDIDPFGLN
jgi:hypothetical protein